MIQETNVDLNAPSLSSTQYTLTVDISDALSERNKVKYTVHTKTNFPEFLKRDISIVREHEEFIWLHYCLNTNENYAGFIIPPAPPRPDFTMLREKLQKLCDNESTMIKENFLKMKEELEQEYLAMFKKTVAMHEIFLCRLASHPIFMKNIHFRAFLEGDNDLCRGKGKKEIVGSFIKRISQSADEMLLSKQREIDEFFEREKNSMIHYHGYIKEATIKADKVCFSRKNLSQSTAIVALNIDRLSQFENGFGDEKFGSFLHLIASTFEKLKKCESRVGSDEELKEADTLRYFTRELQAGKELMYRRLRCLANFETANKNLECVRFRSRDVLLKAELEQVEARKKFVEISHLAKNELINLTKRRVDALKKNFTDLVELEIKQSKAKLSILHSTLETLKKNPRILKETIEENNLDKKNNASSSDTTKRILKDENDNHNNIKV